MLGLTTTRRLRRELAEQKAETDRQRERVAKHLATAVTATNNRTQVLRQNADLDEQLTAARIVNTCLTEDLTAAREQLAAYESGSALSEQMALYRAEKRRADHLQKRLDDALGLDDTEAAALARRKAIPAVKEGASS